MTSKDRRLAALERALDALQSRVDALESAGAASTALPRLTPADAGLVELLRRRAGGAYEQGDRRGAIVYAGAVEIGEREYLWEVERPAPALVSLDPARVQPVFAALASEQRLDIVRELLDGPKSSAELQRALGAASPGQLYHHLKELMATGIVEQRKRSSYQIPARNVVPVLAALALALDLGSGGDTSCG